MRILVTGGAGFIGSHLTRRLLQADHEIVVLDNLKTGLREHVPPQADFVAMDICDDRLIDVVSNGRFDAIVHLAAQTMVDASIREPAYDAQVNIQGTVNVLEAARQGKVQRVVFASTAASYGDVSADQLPIEESQPLSPLSFYGLSKVTVERYLALYQQCFQLDYVVLRFANVYGERQGDGGEGGVISIFTKRLAAGQGITVYGDGSQTRDFVYAGDVANGIYAALTTPNKNTVYNISTQTEISLLELIRTLGDIAGRVITPDYAPPREGDIDRSMLSHEKAAVGLDWQPQVSLREGLRRTYEDFCQRSENK